MDISYLRRFYGPQIRRFTHIGIGHIFSGQGASKVGSLIGERGMFPNAKVVRFLRTVNPVPSNDWWRGLTESCNADDPGATIEDQYGRRINFLE